MSLTAFSVGRDTQIVILSPNGRIDLSHITTFESRQLTNSVRVSRLDGSNLGAELPRGWEGSFEIERGNSNLDDFIASAETAYYSGLNSHFSTMYQYVTELDGSTSTYQFDKVVFKLTNAGTWRGDSGVRQKLEFYAARRRRI